MSEYLGRITATFSILGEVNAPVEDGVRAILASRYLEPTRVRTRSFDGTAFVLVEQPGTNEAEAQAVLREVRMLEAVRSAELECCLERRQPRSRRHPQSSSQLERIDVV
jgi:hypothetical protein